MTTKTRRKWTYKTREAAELAAANFERQGNASATALNAAVSGSIRWLEVDYGTSGSFYRFGVVPRKHYMLVVVVYHCPATGQQPHASAWDEDRLDLEIEQYRRVVPSSHEQREYRDGLVAVRQFAQDMLESEERCKR